MSFRSLRCGYLLTVGVAAALLPEAGRAAVIFESFNPDFVGTITKAPNVNIAPSGGSFDMHAGAKVDFSGPPNTQVFHVPAQPSAVTKPPFFPTTTSNMMPGIKITGNLKQDRQQNVILKGGAVIPRTPPVPYSQTAKDFGRTIPISTNTAFRIGTDPKTSQTSTAEAMAKLTFSTVNNAAVVNPIGTFSEYVRNGKLTTGTGPNGAAGTLIRDPITYSDVPAGAAASAVFSVSSSDFRVQADDPSGFAAVDIQLGTDAFGTAPGSLGFDAEGRPLLMQLDLDFRPSGNIFLQFQEDTSLGTQTFFDPQDGAPITGNVDSFLAGRLASALVFDPATVTWTLSDNIELLGDSFDVPAAMSTLNIDYTLTQEVLGVPEPPTLGLFALPGALLAVLLRRRSTAARAVTE